MQVMPGDHIAGGTVLYKRGVATRTFTLILQGYASIWAGEDAFQSELGAWRHIGERVLLEGEYTPDFSMVTDGACRALQISRPDFLNALESVHMGPGRISSMPCVEEHLPVARNDEKIEAESGVHVVRCPAVYSGLQVLSIHRASSSLCMCCVCATPFLIFVISLVRFSLKIRTVFPSWSACADDVFQP